MALLDNVMSAAAAHGGSLTRAQVRDLGCTDRDIKRWVADGQARVLWRGILAFGAAPDDDTSRHRELVTAVARAYGDRLVISHHSALVMHELPTYDADLAVVRLIRRNKGDSIATGPVRISKCRVDLVDELLNGVLVVTGAVAVAQVAEELGIDAAVVAGDAALHREVCSLQQLAAGAELIGLLRSSPRPRQAVTLMDARSESPGESLLRLSLSPRSTGKTPSGRLAGGCSASFGQT